MTEHRPVTTDTAAKAVPTLPDAQTVTSVKHWTDKLFSFRVTRPASLRFRSGEFVMIGLMGDPHPETGKVKPLLRAYSIASPSWDEELEFYSIKVQDGPLTSRLQHIQVGDQIILRPKPVGTLVHDALFAWQPYLVFRDWHRLCSLRELLREPETYENFNEVIVTHTCRDVAELEYSRQLIEELQADEMMQELIGVENLAKIRYYPTTTREQSPKMGRITTLLVDGTVFRDLGIYRISVETDRAMVCGSMGLNTDIKAVLEGFGLEEGANSDPKHYVVEKAFVG